MYNDKKKLNFSFPKPFKIDINVNPYLFSFS